MLCISWSHLLLSHLFLYLFCIIFSLSLLYLGRLFHPFNVFFSLFFMHVVVMDKDKANHTYLLCDWTILSLGSKEAQKQRLSTPQLSQLITTQAPLPIVIVTQTNPFPEHRFPYTHVLTLSLSFFLSFFLSFSLSLSRSLTHSPSLDFLPASRTPCEWGDDLFSSPTSPSPSSIHPNSQTNDWRNASHNMPPNLQITNVSLPPPLPKAKGNLSLQVPPRVWRGKLGGGQ